MKKSIFILGLLFITSLSFCQTKVKQDIKATNKTENKTYDSKLFGCWKGSETGQQQDGVSKYWVSCRFENGTSTLLFVVIYPSGKVDQTTENGKWWVENGKYYELHNYDGVIDVYDYQVTEEGVNFQSVELMGKMDNTYKFTDYKIAD
ncbi:MULTISPECIES: hypothetical protein [Flavobacterium]|uniref:hypothetical protein n=1 Tax=Flavobacterium TaxID=237 RepID=UPI00248DC834|nr:MULTISPECIES: hypothetical protein [Flavobacterium]